MKQESEIQKLLGNFECQRECIIRSGNIVLYGKTPVLSLVTQAVKEIFNNLKINLFVYDKGSLEGDVLFNADVPTVVILCGMLYETRESMRKEASLKFPESSCFDFFAIYFKWITEYVGRECDYEILADTIVSCSHDKAINNLDCIITTYCSLNCRDCSNGIPYRKERKNLDLAQQMECINRVTCISPISYLNVQGGEPLLDKHLTEWLICCSKNPRIAFITVATNGTIEPTQGVMEAMKHSGAIFRVSDYGECSNQIGSLRCLAADYGVPCDVYERAKSWVICGEYEKHNRSESQNRAISTECLFGTKCLMLYDGVLYCCCRTLFANACGFDDDATRENSLDIRSDIDENKLNIIVNGEKLFLMCDYCDYPMKTTSPAIQIKR